jgi:hypothetical protein
MINAILSITTFTTVVLGVMIILSVANKLSMLSVMVLWQAAGGLFQIRIQSTVLAYYDAPVNYKCEYFIKLSATKNW